MTLIHKHFGFAVICGRLMSSYSPYYVDAVFLKEKQLSKKSLDFCKLNFVPTKAALNSESPSVFFDDLKKKFVCYLTRNGKKQVARSLLEKCFEQIKRIQLERYNLDKSKRKFDTITDPNKLLYYAIENCRPLLILAPIKRGGVKYQVPIPVSEKKSYYLSMKWLLDSANEKERSVHLPDKLAWEILDAAYGQGRVIKKKLDLHRYCESNRAYAHYRWS